jgi:hypothetical protein
MPTATSPASCSGTSRASRRRSCPSSTRTKNAPSPSRPPRSRPSSIRYRAAWQSELDAKLGLAPAGLGSPSAAALRDGLSALLTEQRVDHTLFFRRLADAVRGDDAPVRALFADPGAFEAWAPAWRALLPPEGEGRLAAALAMDRVNPIYVPRNHKVEEALEAATRGRPRTPPTGLDAIAHPYEEKPGLEDFAAPGPPPTRRPTGRSVGPSVQPSGGGSRVRVVLAVGAEAEEEELAALGSGALGSIGATAADPADLTREEAALALDRELALRHEVERVGRVPVRRGAVVRREPEQHAVLAEDRIDDPLHAHADVASARVDERLPGKRVDLDAGALGEERRPVDGAGLADVHAGISSGEDERRSRRERPRYPRAYVLMPSSRRSVSGSAFGAPNSR